MSEYKLDEDFNDIMEEPEELTKEITKIDKEINYLEKKIDNLEKPKEIKSGAQDEMDVKDFSNKIKKMSREQIVDLLANIGKTETVDNYNFSTITEESIAHNKQKLKQKVQELKMKRMSKTFLKQKFNDMSEKKEHIEEKEDKDEDEEKEDIDKTQILSKTQKRRLRRKNNKKKKQTSE